MPRKIMRLVKIKMERSQEKVSIADAKIPNALIVTKEVNALMVILNSVLYAAVDRAV